MRYPVPFSRWSVLFGAVAWSATRLWAADMGEALTTIRAVGPEGQGNAAAAQAWAQVAGAPADQLPKLLDAMNGANERARNYLVAAAATMADRQLKSGGVLPVAELGDFLLNPAHQGAARRLALELIAKVDISAAEDLMPGLLDDPAPELRREAVKRILDAATARATGESKGVAIALYQQALGFARDGDQVEAITQGLKDLGRNVDLVQRLGFVTRWQVIGPFDNTGGVGFDKVYPPEVAVQLDAEVEGREGKVRWKEFVSQHEFGMVDLNKAYAPLKEVAGYAYTVFHSEVAQRAEIRLGCKNGWKLWANGQFLFGRDEYHRGAEIDQYRLPVDLKAGRNTILVKVTQNEQKEEWTVEWEFQLRVTDPSGRVLRSAAPADKMALR
ncbi:MAG: hypothetical protein IT580_02285 [Verrucomicrobiales bacterium]|nr:hypothetical protein [Verrucomicrobiales bacterium]